MMPVEQSQPSFQFGFDGDGMAMRGRDTHRDEALSFRGGNNNVTNLSSTGARA